MFGAKNTASRSIVALAGAGGSHPRLIETIGAALDWKSGTPGFMILDLSAFDRRGNADYTSLDAPTLRPEPAEFGIRTHFRTAGPNLLISGGHRAFERLQLRFIEILRERGVGALLLCHSWGFPEQALARAARQLEIPVFQIDEGPFSLPLLGTKRPETSRRAGRLMLRALRLARLMPPRDMTGALVDIMLVTAPGRRRQLVERGVDPAKLVLVPPPRFDALAEIARQWPERTRTPDRQRVLWLHQPFRADGKVAKGEVDRAESALAGALAEVAAHRRLTIHPRFHPRSLPDERQRVLALLRLHDLDLHEPAGADGSLYDALLQADAAVGFYSSALLEAAVCGMPAIAARLDPDAFAQQSEAAKVNTLAALGLPMAQDRPALAQLVEDGLSRGTMPVPSQLLDEEIGLLDGTGAETVAAHLVAAMRP